jgi:hypothetical protein
VDRQIGKNTSTDKRRNLADIPLRASDNRIRDPKYLRQMAKAADSLVLGEELRHRDGHDVMHNVVNADAGRCTGARPASSGISTSPVAAQNEQPVSAAEGSLSGLQLNERPYGRWSVRHADLVGFFRPCSLRKELARIDLKKHGHPLAEVK